MGMIYLIVLVREFIFCSFAEEAATVNFLTFFMMIVSTEFELNIFLNPSSMVLGFLMVLGSLIVPGTLSRVFQGGWRSTGN